MFFTPSTDLMEIQKRRLRLIQQLCADMKWNTSNYHKPKKTSKLISNDKYKFLYCRIAKIGTTSWKRILLVLSGVVNSTMTDYGFRKLHDYKYSTISLLGHNKNNYTSFLFVRHPFRRLLSAYRDKFEEPIPATFRKIGRRIISYYRPNASESDKNNGTNVSFHEFVRFLLKEKQQSNFNEHWDFQHKICAVCERSYDFIGHFENIVEESNYILHSIGVNNVFFPEKDYNFHATNSSDDNIYLKYFSQIPPEEIFKLYELYRMDFKLFGYSFPKELF
ncbi:carbohydrate sulfotransferase 8-like [Saccoglossus kowalevskii]